MACGANVGGRAASGGLTRSEVLDDKRRVNVDRVARPGQQQRIVHLSWRTGVGLYSNSWEYGTHTWHTNGDTFDRISMDDLRNNATLIAMLAYLALDDSATTLR